MKRSKRIVLSQKRHIKFSVKQKIMRNAISKGLEMTRDNRIVKIGGSTTRKSSGHLGGAGCKIEIYDTSKKRYIEKPSTDRGHIGGAGIRSSKINLAKIRNKVAKIKR